MVEVGYAWRWCKRGYAVALPKRGLRAPVIGKRATLASRLARGAVVLDGAMGTELERRGVCGTPPLWSAAALDDAPELVADIHRAYVAAGAEILVANTFRTNPRTLEQLGRGADGPRLCRAAVELACEAASGAPGPVWVAASVAPAADCYQPALVPDDAALSREHALLAEWLAAAGADLLWIETLGTVREAVAAAHAARAVGLPFAVSFVLSEDGRLLGGDPLAAAVAALEPLKPLALGVNCIPPRAIDRMLLALRALTRRPLIAYGHIENRHPLPGWTYGQQAPPGAYAQHAAAWLAAGASIVGGCCGTTAAHIAAVAAVVRGSPGADVGV